MNYDRIILELLDRVSALEEEVKQLKENYEPVLDGFESPIEGNNPYSSKDTTKYIMDGKRYGKNRLALAIVQKYILNNAGVTAEELMKVFDKSLQGSLGVVRTYKDAKQSYSNSERRFFMQPNEVIHTTTDDCVVCTQWGAFNIDYLIARAQELGFSITKI